MDLDPWKLGCLRILAIGIPVFAHWYGGDRYNEILHGVMIVVLTRHFVHPLISLTNAQAHDGDSIAKRLAP